MNDHFIVTSDRECRYWDRVGTRQEHCRFAQIVARIARLIYVERRDA